MQSNILNKNVNFNVKGFPLDKILSAISNSIIYSILIAYIIYNIIIYINPADAQLSFLRLSGSFKDSASINIFKDQLLILSQFYYFLSEAIQFDFGEVNGSDRFSMIMYSFNNTLTFLFSGLFFSFFLSIILLLLRRFKIIEKTVIKLLCNISLLHISIIFIIFNQYFFTFTHPDISFTLKIFFCSLIVGLGSGLLLDYYNLVKEEFDNIMGKDYVQFAKDSGFNPYRFALKELSFNLISISTSRLPLIFGGLVIIEHKMRSDDLEGISTFIFNRMDSGDDMSIFSAVFICIVFFITIYFFSQKLKESLIKK